MTTKQMNHLKTLTVKMRTLSDALQIMILLLAMMKIKAQPTLGKSISIFNKPISDFMKPSFIVLPGMADQSHDTSLWLHLPITA